MYSFESRKWYMCGQHILHWGPVNITQSRQVYRIFTSQIFDIANIAKKHISKNFNDFTVLFMVITNFWTKYNWATVALITALAKRQKYYVSDVYFSVFQKSRVMPFWFPCSPSCPVVTMCTNMIYPCCYMHLPPFPERKCMWICLVFINLRIDHSQILTNMRMDEYLKVFMLAYTD